MNGKRRDEEVITLPAPTERGDNLGYVGVAFEKGCTTWKGEKIPGKYYVTCGVRKEEDGYVTEVLAFGAKGRFFPVAYDARFNAKVLDRIQAAVFPHTTTIVATMLAGNHEGNRALLGQIVGGLGTLSKSFALAA
jgi:hypothetical protein